MLMEIEQKRVTAILVGLNTGGRDLLEESTTQSMEELEALADAAEVDTVAIVMQNRQTIEAATYIGPGKLQEVCELCQNLQPDFLLFDDELSGSQVRNIEQASGVTVLDRSRLILDIFANRATTREGKCQVELAQLQYLLPRLSGVGASMSRQGAGIGTRGPGETRLETDKRHIRTRISKLKEELKEIEQHRRTTRSKRLKEGIPQVALVGYTNAGKSTLLNCLTDAGTFAKDQLFATLDPLVKRMELSEDFPIVVTDTVGFVRKLPHHLVEAFRSTLEESIYADVVLHVVDVSNPEYPTQMKVAQKLLTSLGVKEDVIITVFNQIDKAKGELPNLANSVCI
ncbi:MAG: GTPase HflX, partial [Ruminococcaceae bacterium]|nr:GTPase HflX [Oscillospiraceae bacterium]